MKKALLIIFLTCLVLAPSLSAQEIVTNQVAFCQHMGYTIDDSSVDKLDCVFIEIYGCNANDFYLENCGSEMIKEFPLRKAGEKVYLEFEKCEEGLSIREPQYLLDLPECYKPSFLEILFKKFF
jgi:hypothetical protein